MPSWITSLQPLLPGKICTHRNESFGYCAAFSLCLSSFFVLNLYLLVPSQVRSLPRNEIIHIKWRIFCTICTAVTATVLYPIFFCHHDNDQEKNITGSPNLYSILGWNNLNFNPLVHAMILYFGPIIDSIVQAHFNTMIRIHKRGQNISLQSYQEEVFEYIRNTLRGTFVWTTSSSDNDNTDRQAMKNRSQQIKWTLIRDIGFAPLIEEIVFRSHIVPPLLSSSARLSITTVSWIAPLFFGMAHFHHAFIKMQDPSTNVKMVIFGTMFQFAYTTLFGAYATYCFINHASLPGIVLAHSFCNWMGLPNLRTLQLSDTELDRILGQSTMLKLYKKGVIICFLLGILGFISAFYFDWGIFSKECILISLVRHEKIIYP